MQGFGSNDFNARQDFRSFDRVVETNNLRRIFAAGTIRGMYTAWNQNANRRYVAREIAPRGEMGALFARVSEDINTGAGTIKMGDTPSVEWARTSPNLNPRRPSQGGQFRSIGNRIWTARRDNVVNGHAGAGTVDFRGFRRDWAAKLEFLYDR